MNKVILIGNLTKDPDLQSTTSGISVCKFTIAVQRKFQNAEGEREADFINIVTWRGLADNCKKFLTKGKKCGVVGQLQTRSYDSQDGSKRYVTEVVAEEVEFLSSNNGSGQSSTDGDKKDEPVKLEPVDDEDLPF